MNGIPLGTGIAIFGAAFAAWAWLVGWGVAIIRREVAALKDEIADSRQSADRAQHDAHRLMIEVEHRLTAVESDIRRCTILGLNGPER